MDMKRSLLYAVALIALASCTSDEYVGGGNSPDTPDVSEAAVVFGSGVKTVTRADHVGADAASLLNNKFIVGGFKGDGSTMTEVFDNYIVNWQTNSAGTTASNTSDWEYVGITAAAPSELAGRTNKIQTIKYWDYSASQYDFVAYSTGDATVITSGDPTSGQVLVTSIEPGSTYGPTYMLRGGINDLAKCYIADMVSAYKADNQFRKEVQFSFRNLASKVRVAIYETVPGYSVKDVYFYQDDSTPITEDISTSTGLTLFSSGTGDTDKFYTAGTYTVSFPTKGSTNKSNVDYNKAHVSFAADGSGAVTKMSFDGLNYAAAEGNETSGSIYLGRSLSTASYAKGASADPWYKTLLPNEVGTVLELRINYTLVSTDGSGETITVHGAKAFVPAVYAQWKPNYAYTYIFKISDATNGWTSTTDSDPAGLYPITFDAIVLDSEEKTQSTITTVSIPSITTYQKGHDLTKDEYAAGDIYVQVMNNDGSLVSDLNATTTPKAFLYTLSANKTEADVMDALNIQASTAGTTITGRNGLVLTPATFDASITSIPDANNVDITVTAGTAAKFTATANTYAFVYEVGDEADTNIYSAITLTSDSAPTDWTGNYWDNPDGTGSAVTTYVKDKTYYKKYTNLNKVYAVKVIKVQ